MNWRKRKKRNRICKHYNIQSYTQYKAYVEMRCLVYAMQHSEINYAGFECAIASGAVRYKYTKRYVQKYSRQNPEIRKWWDEREKRKAERQQWLK